MSLQVASQILFLLLVVVMFGLGLTLTLDNFRLVAKSPKAILVALIVQLFVLPCIALALCFLFNLPPELSVGLMVLAASPGGVSSMIYSHLAKGDLALNMTLTALTSLTSVVVMPAYTVLAFYIFIGQAQVVTFPLSKMVEVFALVVLPAVGGMMVHAKWPLLARRLEGPTKVLSVVALFVIIVATVIKEKALIAENLVSVGSVTMAFNLVSLVIGYYVPLFLKVSAAQSRAIAFEIGLHNGALALYIALNVLNSVTIATPSIIYSVGMYFIAGIFCWWIRPKSLARN